ncbi:hypothetical protein AAFF_G00164170 [Aldrovandia affinis]|uniref:Uncharacterized protein n=1 Tax=Aldrovandia affinis TaxID=143900 RepID=A0AAD7SZF1_9TELE|nr:hypothetical protein AAFF_G00164170 [Aldrovandia affinis]
MNPAGRGEGCDGRRYCAVSGTGSDEWEECTSIRPSSSSSFRRPGSSGTSRHRPSTPTLVCSAYKAAFRVQLCARVPKSLTGVKESPIDTSASSGAPIRQARFRANDENT